MNTEEVAITEIRLGYVHFRKDWSYSQIYCFTLMYVDITVASNKSE